MQFDYRNNVIVDLASAVAAGVTTVNVDPAKQALLPDGVQNTLATLEEIDANGVITLRECVYITNRSGGALTVTRADQLVPASDAATTQTQISYPFDPSNGARIGLYVTKKAFELIEQDIKDLQDATTGDFVTETALIDNVDLYAASVTGTDAYEILIDTLDQGGLPVYTALVDGQRFFVDFDVANVGGSTLTINNGTSTFGPKTLTKLDGQATDSGDIAAGLKTIVMYDAGDDHWRIVGTLSDYSASFSASNLKQDFVLGEDFTSSDPRQGAAFIGKGQTSIDSATQNGIKGFGDLAASEKLRVHLDNTVNVGSLNIASFSFWIDEVGTPADDLEFELFEGAVSIPSDIALTQTTIDGTQQIHVTGRAWFTTILSEKYIEIRRTGAIDAANYYVIERDSTASVSGVTYDSYDGATWNVEAGSLRFTSTFGFEQDKVYKTDTRGALAEAEDMRAKATTTGVAGETKSFYIGGNIPHVAANTNLEYKEHLLVDRIIDDIDIDAYGDYLLGVGSVFTLAGEVGANASVGQTFTMVEDYLYKFSINLTSEASPTDGVTAKIYDTPGGTLLATATNTIDASEMQAYSAVTARPLLTFNFEGFNRGAGNSFYIQFDRTGARDAVNFYKVLGYAGNGSFPAYAGGTGYKVNSGTPAVDADDLVFTAYQSSSDTIATGLYDIDKGESIVDFGAGFFVGNQIQNGLFSLEIAEEQHELRIKQADVQIGSVLYGFGTSTFTVYHDLGVMPRTIEASFTPPNTQTAASCSGMSTGIWVEGSQTCVYGFGDGSTGIQFESGNDAAAIGAMHAERTIAVGTIVVTSVDHNKIVFGVGSGSVFSGFYQLIIKR